MKVTPTPIPDNIWSNPIWNPLNLIVSSTLAIIGIAVTYYIYKKNNKVKGLSYSIVSDSPLLSVGEQLSGKLKIVLDKKEVKDVRLVLLQIWNSGDLPILIDDYNEPIGFNFPASSILEADIIDTYPSELKEVVKIKKTGKLKEVLLNSGDVIQVKFLLKNFDKKVTVGGRIQGVSSITEQTIEESNNVIIYSGIALGIIATGLIIWYILIPILSIFTYSNICDFSTNNFWLQ